MNAERIVVAMSGGVDSAAAALLLAEAGHEVIGVSMQVWDYRKNGGNSARATCCAPSDFQDARIVAEKADFPYYVFDFEDSFEKAVIKPFVDSYVSGYTPNPCLDCNRKVKFRELRGRARTLGANKVATGHYARIREKADGTLALYTSRDTEKDQSYFLYALTQAELGETLFPVGDMEKRDVRGVLEARGLKISSKAESQDICFVSGSVKEFVEKHVKLPNSKGNIVSQSGDVLGEHDGIHGFTVGQRKGLGVSNPEPLYVLKIDPQTQDVTVGGKDDLETKSFTLRDVNWISGQIPTAPIRARVKLRYRHAGVICEIQPLADNRARLNFIDEWTPVSPGQAAVFYNPQVESDGAVEVFGGGIIERALETEGAK